MSDNVTVLRHGNRDGHLTMRVQPSLIEEAKHKIEQINKENFAKAKSRRDFNKMTLADIFEVALCSFLQE